MRPRASAGALDLTVDKPSLLLWREGSIFAVTLADGATVRTVSMRLPDEPDLGRSVDADVAP